MPHYYNIKNSQYFVDTSYETRATYQQQFSKFSLTEKHVSFRLIKKS